MSRRLKEWWYELYIPMEHQDEWGKATKLHILPKDVYEHKEYPTCPQCKEKFVPFKNYKRCFKCRFTTR